MQEFKTDKKIGGHIEKDSESSLDYECVRELSGCYIAACELKEAFVTMTNQFI